MAKELTQKNRDLISARLQRLFHVLRGMEEELLGGLDLMLPEGDVLLVCLYKTVKLGDNCLSRPLCQPALGRGAVFQVFEERPGIQEVMPHGVGGLAERLV